MIAATHKVAPTTRSTSKKGPKAGPATASGPTSSPLTSLQSVSPPGTQPRTHSPSPSSQSPPVPSPPLPRSPDSPSSVESDLEIISHTFDMSSDLAKVSRSTSYKSPPCIGPGLITPQVIHEYKIACDDFFDNVKDGVADNAKAGRLLGGLINSRIGTWVGDQRDALKAVTYAGLLEKIRERALDVEWETDIESQIIHARMRNDEEFEVFANRVQDLNNLLITATIKLSEERLKSQLSANMTKDLRGRCKESESLKTKTDLNEWIKAVKIVDNCLRRDRAAQITLYKNLLSQDRSHDRAPS